MSGQGGGSEKNIKWGKVLIQVQYIFPYFFFFHQESGLNQGLLECWSSSYRLEVLRDAALTKINSKWAKLHLRSETEHSSAARRNYLEKFNYDFTFIFRDDAILGRQISNEVR